MAANTILEATMLVCFGCAWPLASGAHAAHPPRGGSRTVAHRLIFAGYLAGMGGQAGSRSGGRWRRSSGCTS